MRVLVVLGLLGAVAGVADARPGGGGHYSGGGGGHSGGSYHSSSGGSGDASPASTALVLGSAGACGAFAVGSAIRKRARLKKARGERRRRIDARLEELLLPHDPAFDSARFEARTLAVMQRVNEAWCAEDMGAARALVSDGVFVRFNTYLALLAAAGERNGMTDWSAISAEIVGVDTGPRWDVLHVCVWAKARDRDVDRTLSREAAAREVRRAKLEPYGEVWSFVRRRGTTTPADVVRGAVEGVCAKCGAPLPRSQTVRCAACGAVSNSGEHDWRSRRSRRCRRGTKAARATGFPGCPRSATTIPTRRPRSSRTAPR
jgi:hypothetical protein